ncbi:acyl-CoA Delta(11) desaturase-like isoform X2 [Anoplolepis gracilipes]|uniref:acyl-CoA Delta(11) desaturase-like isoform X2 n=1 Tax=Anoplolepis gracilipes TaxID=354296 RepID=UPI003BA3AE78
MRIYSNGSKDIDFSFISHRKNYLFTFKKMDTDMSISQRCTTTMVYTNKVVTDDVGNLIKSINNDIDVIDKKPETMKSDFFNFKTDIIWYIVLQVALLHGIGIYGIFTFNYLENPMTTLWIIGMYIISNFGVSAGAHRLWSHKCYKAKLPLRILLLICFSACAQSTICKWMKNHRMHHKYCDTDADPHNTQRGFFFAHVGWVVVKEHLEFTEKSKQLDLSDIMSDPVVAFGEKHFLLLQLFFGFILPTALPVYFWNETWSRAIISQVFIRYMITLNSVWTINSIAHAWGTRPYDKNIKPADNNFVNYVTMGEGYHNYHHVFSWDYRSAETGNNIMNYTTFFIDIFAKLGLAYDLRYPSLDLIKNIVLNRGDGTSYVVRQSTNIEIRLI